MPGYDRFFEQLSGANLRPHAWQAALAASAGCSNRLIRIPTGFGKTLGILGAWAWHRIHRKDDSWPRRLVWCLPMGVLTDQIELEIRRALRAVGVLWQGGSHEDHVFVHPLMGGHDSGNWHLYPEACAVLIGTQDMLLSRAMNRGYTVPRTFWPVEFGLLNQDCLWVMDEVQLMDVGFATSMQLQALRDGDNSCGRTLRPCFSWWMSATLQSTWLSKSPDTSTLVRQLAAPSGIDPAERHGHLWDEVSKPCRRKTVRHEDEMARLIVGEYIDTTAVQNGPALVVVNRVGRAIRLYQALLSEKRLKDEKIDTRLLHSRFRPAERRCWQESILHRDACSPGTKRIIVATRVIAAGADISAALLVTELAPWPDLVQRFGRCARWGGSGRILVADILEGQSLPARRRTPADLQAAREALGHLDDVSPSNLEAFEKSHPRLHCRLYPFKPSHLLLCHDLERLFDTTPHLGEPDPGVSRYIHSGQERDLYVFWAPVAEDRNPGAGLRPTGEALCAVPVSAARTWICGKADKTPKGSSRKKKMRAWVWDRVGGKWRSAQRRDLYPGQTVLVAANCGGYDPEKGWWPAGQAVVVAAEAAPPGPIPAADDALESGPPGILDQRQTIAVHGRRVGRLARALMALMAPAYADFFDLAGRLHDWGKAHPAFSGSITDPKRTGLHHEVAGALAIFALLRRLDPYHPALLGPWRELFAATGSPALPPRIHSEPATPIEGELLALEEIRFHLAVYLVCTHHGRARMAWYPTPADQRAGDDLPSIMGLKNGDKIPAVTLADAQGGFHVLPGFTIDLTPAFSGLNPKTGMGWTERVVRLLDAYGPFTLAWFEAVFRAADQRTSRLEATDERAIPEKAQ